MRLDPKHVCLILLSTLTPSFAAPPAKGPDYAATAEKIVADVLGVKEKDVVVIEGEPADQPLIEELFVAIGKRGASPLPRLGWPSMHKKWLQSVPEANDAARVSLDEKLVPIVDAMIVLERNDDPAFFADVAPARIAAFNKATLGLDDKRMKRKTRYVGVGNGLTPGKANAKRFGLTEAELTAMFWAGLGTDYKALSARGEAVKAALPPMKEIAVTSPAGTQLKLKLSAKPLGMNDGVITADELKQGGTGLNTWIPAGEVYGLIDAASAEGKIVIPRQVFEGDDIKDLTLIIKAGKVTELTAKPSKAFDRLKALHDGAPAGKEALSIIDFGINTDVKAPKGKPLLTYVPAGGLSFFVGGDTWAGGTNSSPFGLAVFLPDSTVTADGKTVIEKGELKIGSK
jgi:aminopeptidase